MTGIDATNFYSLNGKVALVTGAGSESGIGFAVAKLLGTLGAAVAVTATSDRIHSRSAELRAAGIEAKSWTADLTKEVEVTDLIEGVRQSIGEIDILINNAGMTSLVLGSDSIDSLENLTLADWRDGIARNLDTSFLVTSKVISAMKRSRWGRIVFISSTTGPVMAMPMQSVYASAKAALVGLTKAVALEVAEFGITVNAVAPGWIETGSATDEERAFGGASPVGRPGTADEVAAHAVALCLPALSYTTGTIAVVDGANSIAEARIVI